MPKAIAQNITLSDLNASFDGQPRMLDHTIARALGFVRLADIRGLIERQLPTLERFGEVFRTARKTTRKGGRPGVSYWLNREQSVYICSKSETPNATEVTIDMVRVYVSYLDQKVIPVRAHTRVLPTPSPEPSFRVALTAGRYIIAVDENGRIYSSELVPRGTTIVDIDRWHDCCAAFNRAIPRTFM